MGNGGTIGVYTHKWLTHTPIPLIEAALDMRVCELIEKDTWQWNRGKLEAMFSQRTWEVMGLTRSITDEDESKARQMRVKQGRRKQI